MYGSRSLGSVVLDFGMGLIIPLPHSVGTFPALKHSFKRIYKTDIELSFLNTSEGIYYQTP